MMQTLFLALAAFGLVYFIVVRKAFDFVSTAFIGQVIYFMPGFYGYVASPYYTWIDPSVPIAPGVYATWSFAMAATIFTGWLYRPQANTTWPPLQTSDSFDIVLIGVILASFLAELWVGNGAILSSDKFEVLEGANRFFLLFAAATQLALIAFVLQQKWIKAIVPVISVLFLLYAGFRSEMALALIAIATFMARRKGIWTFARPRYLVPLTALAFVLFTYKSFLYTYRAGRWDLFYGAMDWESISNSFVRSEPFITQSILNEIVIRDISLAASSLFYSALAAIPFLSPIFETDELNPLTGFQDQIFPNLSYGVASNIYANFYATLGVFGIVFFVLIHCGALVAVSKALSSTRNSALRIGLLAIGAFLAFYIHRNDLTNTFSIMNRIVIALVVVWVFSRYLEWPLLRQPPALGVRQSR